MENNVINIYGNEKLISFFDSVVKNGKLAHAYILEGGRGSGKHILARRISCLLVCKSNDNKPCFKCKSCNKILNGISPDVVEITVPKYKKTIGVEQIRELRSSVYVKPSEEEVKVYIISNSEAMTEQAQNVFLKILEEPPKNVYFILLCENTSNILATVKSRAPIMKMQTFSDREMSDYFIDNNPVARKMFTDSPEEFSLIVRISEGKIGQAEKLLEDSKDEKAKSKHQNAKKLIELCADSVDYPEFLLFAQSMTDSREALSDILLYAMYALRDLIAVKKISENGLNMLFYSDFDYACDIASKFTAAGVVKLYDEICSARDGILLNANLNIVITELAYNMKKYASL